MSAPRVAVRVDSGTVIGGGHLSRCLVLAETLRRRGAEVTFISRSHRGNGCSRIAARGFGLHHLEAPPSAAEPERYGSWLGASIAADAAETVNAVEDFKADWVVVDHYGVDIEWERTVRKACGRLLAIDDLTGRAHDCDLLVDHNLQPRDTVSPSRSRGMANQLLGPRYALLSESYKSARRLISRSPGEAARVLVFFGSSEPAGLTATVLRALSLDGLRGLYVDAVVVGDDRTMDEVCRVARGRGRCTVHAMLPSLAGLMLRADIAVGAGGVSALERASLGLPSLVATIANNQRAPAEAMADRGAIVLLGQANRLSERDWAVGLLGLCSDPQRLSEMGRAAAALVDCWGADRVAAAMLGLGDVSVAMRRADADDEALFLDWANDPGVRRSAFNEAPITAAVHREWFARRLADPRTAMFVATGPAGLPIGQVRLDLDETGSSALIDISVDPALRGKGVGTAMLAATEECARRLPGLTRLVAQVRHGNHPSRMMFLAEGFREVATVRDGIYTFELKVGERL